MDVVQRERLFTHIDKGRNQPITWLSSPAGSGKTTLVASWLASRKSKSLWFHVDEGDGDLATFFYYMGLAAKKAAPRFKTPLPLLTPEYLQGVQTFTRRFFETFFSRLKPPFTLVLDNYQNVPPESRFHEMIAHALDAIPAGVKVVIVSRGEPPPALARLRANKAIHHLAWNDIRFTLDESRSLLEQQGWQQASEDALKILHAKTEGWAAGLILFSAQAKGTELEIPASDQLHSREVFDYFASQVFDRANEQTRHFLLTTAHLPSMTVPMAETLTGNAKAGEILEWLVRQHYFTHRLLQAEPGYQYHALFREFLLAKAKDLFAVDILQSIRKQAAELLQEHGYLHEAAGLMIEAKDWPALTALILSQAPILVAQGRSQTITGWISTIPEEIRNADGWLLFWQAVGCMSFDPQEGIGLFERSLHRFDAQGNRTGALMAWSEAAFNIVIGLGYVALLDSWIEWFYRQPQPFEFPSLELEARCATGMVEAMMWRRMQHRDFNMWVKRAQDATQRLGNPQLLLRIAMQIAMWTGWTGDVAKALAAKEAITQMANTPGVPPLVLLMSKGVEAVTHYWATGERDQGYAAVLDGLQLAEELGIHIWDYFLCSMGVYGAILKGDREKALEFLDTTKRVITPDNREGQAQWLFLQAWYHIIFGDPDDAMQCALQSLNLTVENRGKGDAAIFFPEYFVRSGLQNVLCEIGDYKGARQQLAVEMELSSGTSATLEFKRFLVLARIELGEANEEAGLAALRSAMEIARRHSFVSTFWWWQPKVMSELCARALESGIEVEHVQKIIRVHQLPPPVAYASEHWPWPIRIYTQGKFEIVKDGKLIEFKGKVQKKPIELLKFVVDNGGQATEAEISDALWHKAEGDFAYNSFKMALSRLRNLIGKEAIKFQAGKISLNSDCCWVEAHSVYSVNS